MVRPADGFKKASSDGTHNQMAYLQECRRATIISINVLSDLTGAIGTVSTCMPQFLKEKVINHAPQFPPPKCYLGNVQHSMKAALVEEAINAEVTLGSQENPKPEGNILAHLS